MRPPPGRARRQHGADGPPPGGLAWRPAPPPRAMPEDPSSRRAGLVAVVLGAAALVVYAVFGAGPQDPGLPAGRLSLAALLVIVWVAVRQERVPSWARFVAALLAGLIAADLLLTYLA